MKAVATLAALAVVCCATTAMASDLTLRLECDAPEGGVADYRIYGLLSDELNEGLALFGFDMEMVGVNLETAATVTPNSPTIDNFVEDAGLTNPAGFAGTPSGDVLLQIGGGQNTIKDSSTNGIPPDGDVTVGVAKGAETLLVSGTIVLPGAGPYTLELTNGFANVIAAGEDGSGAFWAVEAVGTVTGDSCDFAPPVELDILAAASNFTHGAAGTFGVDIFGGATEGRFLAGQEIVLTFEADVDVPAIEINGGAFTDFSTAVAGDQVTITFNSSIGNGCHTIDATGTTGTGGETSDYSFSYVSLEGNTNADFVTSSIDFSAIKARFGQAVDAGNFVYDLNKDGIISSIDSSGVKARFGDSASCP